MRIQAGACRFEVLAAERAPSDALRSRNFAITADPTRRVDAVCDPVRRALVAGLQAWDVALPGIRAGGEVPARSALDAALVTLAAFLDGVVAVCGVALVFGLGAPLRTLFVVVAALAFAARAAWPHALTAVGFGYEWFADAAFLHSVPRYGPGAPALWGKLLGPLTHDHGAVLWLHAALGSIACGIWAAFVATARGSLRAGWLAGGALALTPLFLREHTSESMHTAVVLGLGLAALALAQPRPARGVAAAAFVWAVGWRVDVGPAAVLTLSALHWARREHRPGSEAALPGRPGSPARWLLPALAAGAGLVALAVFAQGRLAADLHQGNLPQLQSYLSGLGSRLAGEALPWRADWFPVGVWLAVLLAIAQVPGRAPWRWLAVAASGLPWLLLSWLDFNETSLPRLQAPAAWLAVVAAAGLADLALENVSRPRVAATVLVFGFASSAVLTLPQVLRRTNSHLEDDLLREAIAALPNERPFVLATRTYAEGPAIGLHLHQPTYALQPPALPGTVVTATAMLEALRAGTLPHGELWFLRSLRCYLGPVGSPAAGREHPACAALAAWPGAVAAFERDVPNRGESPTFDGYGKARTLRVGLYRLPETLNRTGSAAAVLAPP
ncbi:MAG: hypothetical protein EXR79_00960 [Myxococcales bacterium]|nr:hypothetical protein [Myxococcales bacterium]